MNVLPKSSLAKHFFVPPNYNSKCSPQTSKNNSYQGISKQLNEYDIIRIHKQNCILRQQNDALKKQLNELKKEQNKNSPQNIDFRQTVKKQSGQIKQLKMRLEILSKQCTVYEEIIQKMQERIKKLTIQNKKYNQIVEINKIKEDQLETLQKKTQNIYSQYLQLELKVKANQLEWVLWKDHWQKERFYYIDKINNIQKNQESKYQKTYQYHSNKYSSNQNNRQN